MNKILILAVATFALMIAVSANAQVIYDSITCTNCILDNPTFINFTFGDIVNNSKVNKTGDTLNGTFTAGSNFILRNYSLLSTFRFLDDNFFFERCNASPFYCSNMEYKLGVLDMGNGNISNVLDPISTQDATTKNYVDTKDNLKLNITDFTNYSGNGLDSFKTDGSFSNGSYAIAMGYQANASNTYSFASGRSALARGYASVADGYTVSALGDYSAAFGANSFSNGSYGFSSGRQTHADGYASSAIGFNTISSGQYSYAGGYYSQTTGDYSFAFGRSSIAHGQYSYSLGRALNVSGTHSFGIGLDDTTRTYTSSNMFRIEGGNLSIGKQSGTGIRAACFDSNGNITASTNATSNYLTC